MNNKLAKYGILSFVGIILMYQFLPIGDYCSGLLNLLNSLFLLGLLIIILLVLTIRNLIRLKNKNGKFDFVPLIIVLIFGTIWYILVDIPNKKFWTEKSLVGFIEMEGTPKRGTLELFKNGSFGASYHRADYSCSYQGDYEIVDNRLILERADLTELTDSVFTTKYLINLKDSILKPMQDGFKEIGISKIVE